jgi:hypothetical protein
MQCQKNRLLKHALAGTRVGKTLSDALTKQVYLSYNFQLPKPMQLSYNVTTCKVKISFESRHLTLNKHQYCILETIHYVCLC